MSINGLHLLLIQGVSMLSRKDKKQVITQEKKIIYGDEELSGKEKEIGQAVQAYTHAAKWFEKNVAEGYRRQARNSRYLSIFFGVLAFMSMGAVLGLTPLKTVAPYLVRVDNNSGYTDIVAPLTAGKKPEQVQDEYWLATYVRTYESYNWSSQTSNYALIKLLSHSEPFTEYKNFQLSSKGYTEVLGKNLQIRTKINNVVPLRAARGAELQADKNIKTYQVRFTKTILDRNGNPDPQSQITHWLATVSFDYNNPSVTQEDRWLNPMEFGVHAYSKTQEVKGG